MPMIVEVISNNGNVDNFIGTKNLPIMVGTTLLFFKTETMPTIYLLAGVCAEIFLYINKNNMDTALHTTTNGSNFFMLFFIVSEYGGGRSTMK